VAPAGATLAEREAEPLEALLEKATLRFSQLGLRECKGGEAESSGTTAESRPAHEGITVMESTDPFDDKSPLYHPDDMRLQGPSESATRNAGAWASEDARINHLQRVPLFGDCTDEELRRVAEISRIVETPAGTVVTEIGRPGDSFFLIIDGRVSVQTAVGGGEGLHPGDFFGEMSLLDGEPRSATVTAMTELRLLVVDRLHFWRLLNETPDLVRRMLTVLSRRVRRLEQTGSAMLHRMNVT